MKGFAVHPILRLAALCLMICALPHPELPAQTETAPLETSVGTITSVDKEVLLLKREKPFEDMQAFRIDGRLTPVYRGLRSLSISEMQPGMRVEVDHRTAPDDTIPAVRWIEIITKNDK